MLHGVFAHAVALERPIGSYSMKCARKSKLVQEGTGKPANVHRQLAVSAEGFTDLFLHYFKTCCVSLQARLENQETCTQASLRA